MKISEIVDIVTKYFANWGDEQVEYRFDGYKNGVLVKSVTRTAVTGQQLVVKADSDTLIEDKTYDVTRVELMCQDLNGNRLPFANNSIKVRVDGPATVIGPDEFALVGGARAFWLKTAGKSGDVTVTVTGENLGEHTLTFKVIKK